MNTAIPVNSAAFIARMVAYLDAIKKARHRAPGPWLKHKVGTGPIHVGVTHGNVRVLPSGAAYDMRRDGWRRVAIQQEN